MSKPANKTLVGAFVVGAMVLALTAVVMLGSGKFFKERAYYILYFEGTIEGLTAGSPVTFRGVKIGTVKDIGIRFNAEDLSFLVPVTIELTGEQLEAVGADDDKDFEDYMKLLISKGMKAQLEVRSIVTGMLSVNLDFFPNKPLKLYGINKKYTEIPTIPMNLEEISKTLQDIPFKELYDKLYNVVSGIDKIVNSSDTKDSIKSLREGLKESVAISKTINAQLEPTIRDLRDTSNAIKGTFVHLEKALSGEDGISGQLKETLKTTRSTLKQAEQALIIAQKSLGESSIVMHEIDNTLDEISRSARSLRFLTEYLQTHPESVISGKKRQEGE